jgi:holo-[acyl-carrier protein] synthase
MIIGIGSDLCVISRIEGTLAKFGKRFEERCFTELERRRANHRPLTKAATYAKRFAAKEAMSKALGTGMRHGVAWRDIGVVNQPSGQPTIELTGASREVLMRKIPDNYEPYVFLTMTDDNPYAMAFVIIEARLKENK